MTGAITSREEVLVLARQAGLDLPPEYLDELVEVHGFVTAMVARLPGALPHAAEPAHVFVARRFMGGFLGGFLAGDPA